MKWNPIWWFYYNYNFDLYNRKYIILISIFTKIALAVRGGGMTDELYQVVRWWLWYGNKGRLAWVGLIMIGDEKEVFVSWVLSWPTKQQHMHVKLGWRLLYQTTSPLPYFLYLLFCSYDFILRASFYYSNLSSFFSLFLNGYLFLFPYLLLACSLPVLSTPPWPTVPHFFCMFKLRDYILLNKNRNIFIKIAYKFSELEFFPLFAKWQRVV